MNEVSQFIQINLVYIPPWYPIKQFDFNLYTLIYSIAVSLDKIPIESLFCILRRYPEEVNRNLGEEGVILWSHGPQKFIVLVSHK